MTRRANPWIGLAWDSWALGLEMSSVIGLRMVKLMAGGAAASREQHRMIAEKLQAGLELQGKALTGGLGATPEAAASRTLAHYRRKVRANRKRLGKA